VDVVVGGSKKIQKKTVERYANALIKKRFELIGIYNTEGETMVAWC
jgi:hypothetical protein